MKVVFTKFFTVPGIRVYQSGDEAELPDTQAQNLIHHGIAIPVVITPAAKAETAVMPKRKREKR